MAWAHKTVPVLEAVTEEKKTKQGFDEGAACLYTEPTLCMQLPG